MPAPQPLEVRVELRSQYVFVWQRGLATQPDELLAMQREIETAMDQVGTRSVMFDNRETEKPDEGLRALMWGWLTETVGRAAFIQNEVRTAARAERTAMRNRVLVRAFHDEAEAEAWLQS